MSSIVLDRQETKSNILEFTKNQHLLLIDIGKLWSVQILDPSYLRNEVGRVFDVVQFRDRVFCYQKINREIDDLSNRVIGLQRNPKWEKAKYALRGLSLLAVAIAATVLAIGIFYFLFFTGKNPGDAFIASIPIEGTLLVGAGWFVKFAIDNFKVALENLRTVQGKLANKKHIATDLETKLLESEKTLRNIKESLIAKNAKYEQVAHDDPTLSYALSQSKQRNSQQLASIDWLNIL